MNKQKALSKITNALETLKDIPDYQVQGYNEELKKWEKRTLRHLDSIFGATCNATIQIIDIDILNESTTSYDFSTYTLRKYLERKKEIEIILESCIEEIEEWEEDQVITESTTSTEEDVEMEKTKVFIVHGHDSTSKLEVARFIEKLGFEPIILHEQVSGQKTIIEKIEDYADQVNFGIVLYTACDVGGKNAESLQSRARQNVVFEHGYLIGKLGRSNVCPLVKGNIEKPGDIGGVVYTPMDDAGSWHLPLAKELTAAGYKFDSAKLLA